MSMLQELAEHIPTGKGVRTSMRHSFELTREQCPQSEEEEEEMQEVSYRSSIGRLFVFPERSTARHHSLDNNVCKIYGQALITSLGSSATCSEASTDSSSRLPRVPSPR